MTLMHTLLSTYLRFVGRFRDAAEVDEAAAPASSSAPREVEEHPPSSSLPESTPALVIHGDERDVAAGHAGTASGAGAGAHEAATSSGSNLESGGGGMGVARGGSSGGAGGSGTGSDIDDAAAGENKQHTDAHSQSTAEPPVKASDQPPDIHSDPFVGIKSEGMRRRIENDAFRTSSSTAQDSEIVAAADRIRSLYSRRDFLSVDISDEARKGRIEELRGDIPEWAKGNPKYESALNTQRIVLREPTKSPARTSDLARVDAIARRASNTPGVAPIHAAKPSPGPARQHSDHGREM